MSFWKKLFGQSKDKRETRRPTLKELPNVGPMSEMDSKMNAAANVIAYQKNGWIEFLTKGSEITGIWVKALPGNTFKRDFLAMFCAIKKQEDAHIKILSGAYHIMKATGRDGFDIYFE